MNLPPVGSSVFVASTLYRENDGKTRKWLREADMPDAPRPLPVRRAVVTGYSHRCDGVYHPASGGGYSGWGDEPSDPDPAYLAVTKRHRVVLLRFSAWGPEFIALAEDVMPAPDDGWTLPSKRGGQTWTPEARAALAAESRAFPRDARGRFLKG